MSRLGSKDVIVTGMRIIYAFCYFSVLLGLILQIVSRKRSMAIS